jgi:hypothetical protein
MGDLIERLRDRASRFRGYVDGRGAASSELDEAADAPQEANARIADLLMQLEQKEVARHTLAVGYESASRRAAELEYQVGASPSAVLTEAVDLTIKTLERQLDLIDERAPGNYLDKMPVIRSLSAHKKRLERAVEQAKEKK